MILERRDCAWEQDNAGMPIKSLPKLPPCMYSVNAFGEDELTAFAPPPSWFRDGTQEARWLLPPATVSLWPYEEMYNDDVLSPSGRPKYNAQKRSERAADFFSKITPAKSLIFYYANYSNPFNEDEQNNYVIVGVSRIKEVGPEIRWQNQSTNMEQQYGGHVWDRNVTSDYPHQGFRIPYHRYINQPEVLEQIVLVPENPRLFKYATRHVSDDEALALVEQLSEVVAYLQGIGDTSEDWNARQVWLQSVTAELWQSRGLHPGLTRVLDYLKFSEAIPFVKSQVLAQHDEQQLKDQIFSFLDKKLAAIPGLSLDNRRTSEVQRSWLLYEDATRTLLRDALVRFDLRADQIRVIVEYPDNVSITADHDQVAENPYILCEQYIGLDQDDFIRFNKIDHGMLPAPNLGSHDRIQPDDTRRLRALCVEQLRKATEHTFLSAAQIIEGINQKLATQPDWKRVSFTQRHLEIDEDELTGALLFRRHNKQLYLYRRDLYDDERVIEQVLRQLAARPNIPLRSPVRDGDWKNFLLDLDSTLAQRHREKYDEIIEGQAEVCQTLFLRPISVISGAAGTGKTTLVRALIKAIDKGHGVGTSFQLLAPTGKAADRLREKTDKPAATIHSFLAQRGWMNDNMSYRRTGSRETQITTYIIDESSMLDLPLLAAFFRAVNWNTVQRLIFVGDPNQLPPIGTGKIFADLIDWLQAEQPESIGTLAINVRQIESQITGAGTGILDLAALFIRRQLADQKDGERDAEEEQLLAKVQEGGDLDGDLRVLFWQNTDHLEQQLLETIVADLEHDTGTTFDPLNPERLWNALLKPQNGTCVPERQQVISPYRGELFGVEHLNLVLQRHKNGKLLDKQGKFGGVTYFDKVIQVINRSRSNPIWAWNTTIRKSERTHIFNGEIGMTQPHFKDSWQQPRFRIKRFNVTFSRKHDLLVGYDSESDVEQNLELAYAISVHKSQGSEFDRVYFVLPKNKRALLSRELFYTGVTRARTHCTLLVEEDIGPLLSLRRPESSQLARINSSLFDFRPAPLELQTMSSWYAEGRIHRTLANIMVRSKSEVIIANMLSDRDIPFAYEVPLVAQDGTRYLPDFTIQWRGETWYWEHWGMLGNAKYRAHQQIKRAWYQKHNFDTRLIETEERDGFDSQAVQQLLLQHFGIS